MDKLVRLILIIVVSFLLFMQAPLEMTAFDDLTDLSSKLLTGQGGCQKPAKDGGHKIPSALAAYTLHPDAQWYPDADLGLFNLGDKEATVTAKWSDLKLSGKLNVRDLWRQKDLGQFDGQFQAAVSPHGAELVKTGHRAAR